MTGAELCPRNNGVSFVSRNQMVLFHLPEVRRMTAPALDPNLANYTRAMKTQTLHRNSRAVQLFVPRAPRNSAQLLLSWSQKEF